MFKSLWFRLSVSFTLLIVITPIVIRILLSIFLDSAATQQNLVPKAIYDVIFNQQLVLAQVIKEPDSEPWRALAKRNLFDNLVDISMRSELADLQGYFETKAYFKLFNNKGELVLSEPSDFPADIVDAFALPKTLAENDYFSEWQEGDTFYYWLSLPVADGEGVIQGNIELLFADDYEMSLIYITFHEGWKSIATFLLLLLLIGLVCGVTAAWFVTRRFKRVNEVISIWRKGDFKPRIAVSRMHDDVLAEHNRSLNEMADDLSTLFSLKERMAVTEEKNRVARELHDTVKQNLFALNLQLAAIKHRNERLETLEHIIEAEKITREAQSDLIQIITQLRPSEHDDEYEFYNRISMLADDVRKRFNVELVWQEKAQVRMTQNQEHTLLRIAQEAISNAVRHGKANKITMSLSQENNINRWRICDNGGGFCLKKSMTGFGLTFMRERAAGLPEGKFAISSRDGKGAMITVQWRAS